MAFIAPVKFPVLDAEGNTTHYVITAIIDSGLPVALIKYSLVPFGNCTLISFMEYIFRSVNDSPLVVQGVFNKEVDVDGITVQIKFLVFRTVRWRTLRC